MRITSIVEEELTHKVLASFNNNFAMSGLGRLLDMVLDEGVNVHVVISAVANLDEVPMVAQMNGRTLSGVIAVEIEDLGVAWCNAPRRLLTNPTY